MKHTVLLISLFLNIVCLNAQPKNSPPTPPTRNAADVISIYGGAYAGITGVNFNPNWGQSGAVNPAYDPGTGDVAMAYTNFNYQGTGFEGNAQNASEMEFVHIDVWTNNATVLKFTPIDNSGNGPGEVLVDVMLKAGEWSSVDLPKSAFTGMSWKSVIQLKFDGQAGVSPSDIYLDNIYFWKKPAASGEDATLKELKVDGNQIPGFAPSALKYSYGVPGGGAVPQITLATTNDANATITKITQATAVPGDATVLVTAGNGTTTATYTISYFYASPENPAPTPTATTVLSMYSDAYTNVEVDTWRTDWSQATFEATTIKGNATLKYTNLGFNGIETVKKPVDASAMTTMHMDVWSPNITVFNVKLVSFMGDGFGGANGDSEANINANLIANQWNSIAIPLKDFTDAGLKSLKDLSQLIFTSTPFGSGIAFVDNIYFSGTTTGINENTSSVALYPNPIQHGGTLNFSDPVKNVEIFAVSGQKVIESQEQTITLSNLPAGLYTVKSIDQSGVLSVHKLIIR
ncbi:MAG: T9SS type A sorting domain-containing protein [Ignavibacteria bacterium]|nr:T9SS type A sorting domain-containing protein [Ignavibacteria bacterium]